jgi:hypothetical protein
MEGMYIIIFIALAILIFILCREFFCWYFKLTRIVELLSSINSKLPGDETKTSSKEGTEEILFKKSSKFVTIVLVIIIVITLSLLLRQFMLRRPTPIPMMPQGMAPEF